METYTVLWGRRTATAGVVGRDGAGGGGALFVAQAIGLAAVLTGTFGSSWRWP